MGHSISQLKLLCESYKVGRERNLIQRIFKYGRIEGISGGLLSIEDLSASKP